MGSGGGGWLIWFEKEFSGSGTIHMSRSILRSGRLQIFGKNRKLQVVEAFLHLVTDGVVAWCTTVAAFAEVLCHLPADDNDNADCCRWKCVGIKWRKWIVFWKFSVNR